MKFYQGEYSSKVWLVAALFGPIGLIVYPFFYSTGKFNLSLLQVYHVLVVIELTFSFLTWLLFVLVVEIVTRTIKVHIIQKSVLSLIGIALTLLTIYWFCGIWSLRIERDILAVSLTNSICIVSGIWFFKTDPPVSPPISSTSNTPPINSNEN